MVLYSYICLLSHESVTIFQVQHRQNNIGCRFDTKQPADNNHNNQWQISYNKNRKKNWKVCLTRSPVWLAGAILQMFWSVKQHNKNVKCVETTLTKLCNQSNHSMKSHVIKIPICHSHWSAEPPSTSGINLIKILGASPVSDIITGVSFNMSDLWCHWWGSRSPTQTESGHYHKMCHNPTPIYLFGSAESTRQDWTIF